MNTDIMQLLAERREYNNYDRIDGICGELTALMGGNLRTTPIFYRDNMIIVRRSFLQKLFSVAKSEKLVRAIIYITMCMLVLHAPAVPIKESDENTEDESIKDLLHWSLCDYDEQGISRETFIKQFHIERNTFTIAMSILIRTGIIVQLSDGSYAFAIEPEKVVLENRNLSNVKNYLSDLLELVTAFQQADLLTGMRIENDGDSSDEIVFASDDEAAEIVADVLENCTIQRWIDELLDVIRLHDGNYGDNAVAAKLVEFLRQTPMVSACAGEFCLIRQEMLEYILLHGYREPLLDGLNTGTEEPIPKSAMVILLYMIFVADEEGYLRKTGASGDMLQSKDIANECGMSVASVSKALSCWKSMNVVEIVEVNGVKGMKFCNSLTTPNVETTVAIIEADRIAKDPSVKGYRDVDEMFEEILR